MAFCNAGAPLRCAWFLGLAMGVVAAAGCGSRAVPKSLESDLFVGDDGRVTASAEKTIRPLIESSRGVTGVPAVVIDYPSNGSLFPPEIVAPTFLWHDPDNSTTRWLIDVSFKTNPHHVYGITSGKRAPEEIDPETVTENNTFHESPYQASAKTWTPDEGIWTLIKKYSAGTDAQVTVFGVGPAGAAVTSRGDVTIRTSTDPVGALIFYRDVPLMPSVGKAGVVQPLKDSALPLIKWRLRELSKPEAPVVMQYLPTCGNCHSFSSDGKTLAMDIDGPAGDKGAHVVVPVSKRMVIRKEDVFTWNSFRGPNGEMSFGMFPRVSPDGRYDIATVHEYGAVFVRNYKDYRYLQSFYPTGGILAFYTKATGEIKALPGADDRNCVQTNAVWSPDGKTIVFLRAKAREPFPHPQKAEYANDPHETPIQYDLYRIPFNEGKGGTAEPVPGASQNGMSNSFPKFSPDGKWIVFVECKNGMLMRPDSKLYIMSAQGGTPRLMSCNTSNMNSWHSWSPNSRWLVFSSKVNTPFTQMFLTHIDESGNDSPAILVPNSTAANRAVNIPEFVNVEPGAIEDITTTAVEYKRLLDKGKELILANRIPEAEIELKKSLDMKSDYPETLNQYAILLVDQGRLDEAIGYCRKAIEIEPRYWPAFYSLGIIFGRQGKVDEAIVNFKRTVELDPENSAAEFNWGNVLRAQGRINEALTHYRRAAAIKPTDATLTAIGVILIQKGRPGDAVPNLRNALKANPNHVEALNALALVFATAADGSLRDGKEAVRLAENACRLTRNGNAHLLDTLACAYAEVGRFDEAVRTESKALALARGGAYGQLVPEIQSHLDLFRKQKPFRLGK